jgi:regulator of RNase E activity RraA
LQALDAAPKGTVLVIDNVAAESEAMGGDIFAEAAKSQGLAGIVVNGAVRDIDGFRSIDLPIYSREVTFVCSKVARVRARQVPARVNFSGVEINPGDWVFGDSDGLLVVERQAVSIALSAALALEERESALKQQLAQGRRLADIANLHAYLEGRGDLLGGF